MKTTMIALCFLCATAAFGQTGTVLSNSAQPFQIADHVQHASEHPMGTETSLFGASPYSFAQGEVPLADLASPIYHTPLGDIARANKKDHATVPKAVKTLEQ
jgi:hypothetical protein